MFWGTINDNMYVTNPDSELIKESFFFQISLSQVTQFLLELVPQKYILTQKPFNTSVGALA